MTREIVIAPRHGNAHTDSHPIDPPESKLPVPAQSATKKNHGSWVRWGQGLLLAPTLSEQPSRWDSETSQKGHGHGPE